MDYLGQLEKLPKALRPVSEEQGASAAVALLLRKIGRDFQVLVVKRAEMASDPWSGQMALPGGKREARDRSLKETIIREAFEETGIDLRHHCRFLGTMEPQTSTPRPEMKILPFVILLEREPVITLDEELQEYTWISLMVLDGHRGKAKFSFGDFPAYLIEGFVIWGFTYRILEKFLEILVRVR